MEKNWGDTPSATLICTLLIAKATYCKCFFMFHKPSLCNTCIHFGKKKLTFSHISNKTKLNTFTTSPFKGYLKSRQTENSNFCCFLKTFALCVKWNLAKSTYQNTKPVKREVYFEPPQDLQNNFHTML